MTFEEFILISHEVLDSYEYVKIEFENQDSYYVVSATFSSIESLKLNINKWWNVKEYKEYLKNYIKYIDR